jgi:sortase A
MPTNSILRWSGCALFTAGLLVLGYVCYAVVDAKLYQQSEARQFQRAVSLMKPAAASGESPSLVAAAEIAAQIGGNSDIPVKDEAETSRLGRIEIGVIGVDAIILEGTDDLTLRRAVGHLPGTALPGQNGNVAIAGHRDTFFRGLRNIHKDNEITLTTLKASYLYKVDSTEVVDPQDADVLDESDDPTLTLITCYPFNFVGSAPRRFIVRASKVSH